MTLVRGLRRRHLLLAAPCAALAGLVAVEAQLPFAVEAPPASAASAASGAVLQDGAESPLPPLGRYAEVVERPLFSETRRPVDAAPPSAAPPAFGLVGIVISLDDRHALIAHGQPQHLERFAEGDTIEGWRIDAIRSDAVTLHRAEATIELSINPNPTHSASRLPAGDNNATPGQAGTSSNLGKG